VDPALGHELLELLQGGVGSLPLKPPMAMTGSPVAQLDPGGRVGPDRGRHPRVTVAIRAATASPPSSTRGASSGCQSGVRRSSTHDQTAVTATVPASHQRVTRFRRTSQRPVAPMPTKAPTAGARATA
jgi:hypothetical protein